MDRWPQADSCLDFLAQVAPLVIWATSFWSYRISCRGSLASSSFSLASVFSFCYVMIYHCFYSDFYYPHVNHSPPKWSYIECHQRVIWMNLEHGSKASARSNNFSAQNSYWMKDLSSRYSFSHGLISNRFRICWNHWPHFLWSDCSSSSPLQHDDVVFGAHCKICLCTTLSLWLQDVLQTT